MNSKADIKRVMNRGAESLKAAVGERFPTIRISSQSPDEAVFLGQNISKLSPLISNLIERRIPALLSESDSAGTLEWRRQDPDFPDAALFAAGKPVGAGFEVKAWYPMATEITGRFRESQNLLEGKDIRVVVAAWMLSHIVFGEPEIVGMLVVDALSVAKLRDQHYHNPPDYICEEPQDTTARTRNLQQTNVLGYKLQEQNRKRLQKVRHLHKVSPYQNHGPETETGQELARQLRDAATYRLDSNFAKIDRIDHPEIEDFKQEVLTSLFQKRSIQEWAKAVRTLRKMTTGEPTVVHRQAMTKIAQIYEDVHR